MSASVLGPRSLSTLLLAITFGCATSVALGQTLVGNVFSNEFQGWTDVNGTTGLGPAANWGVLLTEDKPLIESSDGRVAESEGGDGLYQPFIMIKDNLQLSGNYTINATLGTTDNDGLGIVFGYVDENNYFRYGMRHQTPSNLGFPYGNSLQKVVNGQITHLYADNFADHEPDGVPINVSIQVEGQMITLKTKDFTHPVIIDSDLQAGKLGVHSWYGKQLNGTSRQYGSMFHEISVTGSTNHTTNFDDAVVASWRPLVMFNALGETGTPRPSGDPPMLVEVGEFHGNFRQDFRNGTIVDDSNGNLNGTDINGNSRIDFIGPAVVIDEPGNGGWDNYVMATRLMTNDNDGIGVVFRVGSDNNSFYRINFMNEAPAPTNVGRPARGMSMQKFDNGTWTELYSENSNPQFVFTPGVPFDLSIIAEGNTFKVGIVNDPDGAVTAINYDPIVDADNPLLTGSVGFANWGNGDNGFGSEYSAYGGGDTPLLSATLPQLDLTVNRSTGEVTLQNNGAPLAIDYYELTSAGNSLNPAVGTGNNQWTPLDLAESDPAGQGWDPAGSASSSFLAEGRLTDAVTIAASASLSLGEAYNGVVNAEDIRFRYRLDNGMFVLGDVSYVGVAPVGLAGDFNNDGTVDARDFVLWRNNLGNPESVLNGNGNNSGVVDIGDYSLWKDNYGETAPGALALAQSVPEPGTWAIATVGALAMLRLRRRRRTRQRALKSSQGMPIMSKVITTSLAVMFLLALTAQPARSALVARYLLDGTYNDSSGNGYHGTVMGTPTFVDDPTFGTVLRIPDSGDHGVDLDGVKMFPDFPANSSITLMAWYKRTSDPDGEFRYVVNLGQNGDAPIATLGVRASQDQIASYIETDQPGSNADQVNTFGTTRIEGGAAAWSSWHHLAVVYDRATDIASVYLDGALDNTNSIEAVRDEYGFTWPRATIGRGPSGGSSAPGFIHDVQIYDHALNHAQLLDAIGQPVFEARVNRTTGELIIENISNVVGNFSSYSITSPDGALDPNGWDSVTDNWDMGGPGSIDTNPWSVTSATNNLLSEAETPFVNGGTLAPGQTVNLGNAWIKSISENMTLEVTLNNGLKATSAVLFEGGFGDAPYLRSDLNFDNEITLADWQVLVDNFGADFSVVSPARAYAMGDLNLDGISDGSDFATFKNDFDAANGAGAFQAAIASQVPEPATLGAGLIAAAAVTLLRRRHRRVR